MGVESGSLYVVDGDPLTPAYPAIGKKLHNKNDGSTYLSVVSTQKVLFV